MLQPSPLDALEARTWQRFAPPPRLTLSAWADWRRVLAPESSAEPGRWKTSRTPYLREPMDVIADRHVETVVVMASSQVGKTEVLLNLVGYHIDLDPAPMMLIEPTLDLAGAISKDRITPMLRDTSSLAGKVAPARSRDASNTTLHKSFTGGALTLAGANSPASLASRPIRVLLCDEVDRWPGAVGEEGDPLSLAIKRTTTFHRRKIVIVSSPTIKGASRIEDWFAISDQRRYHTPCLHCGALFVLAWSHVRWESNDPTTAHLECPHCQARITDHQRRLMVEAGQWAAGAAFTGIAGFHLWEMFSPWVSLRDQVANFLKARRSLEMRQAWTNTALGLCWEAPGEKIESASLLLRREDYGDTLPAGVQVLTMGVDTQDDRLELIVLGWGAGEEAWVVDRQPLMGDPNGAEVWQDLDQELATDWPHASGGSLRVACTLVDSAGHRTQGVYRAILPRQRRRVYAAIGRAGGQKGLLVSPPHPVRPKDGTGTVQLRTIDVDQVKALVFARLKVGEVGPEYVHFPRSVGETFFDELTAEKLITKRNKYGVPSKQWQQFRDRNEALDCFVLATAALRIIAPTPERFARVAASLAADRRTAAPVVSTAPPAAPVTPPPRAGWIAPRRSDWLKPRR